MSFIQTSQQAENVLLGAALIFSIAQPLAARGNQTVQDIKNITAQMPLPNWAVPHTKRLHDLMQSVAILTGLSQEMTPSSVDVKLMNRVAKIQSGKTPLPKAIAIAEQYLEQLYDWSWFLHENDRLAREINAPGFIGAGYNSYFDKYVFNALGVWNQYLRSGVFGPLRPSTVAPPRFRGYRPIVPAPMHAPVFILPLPPKTGAPIDDEIDLFAD